MIIFAHKKIFIYANWVSRSICSKLCIAKVPMWENQEERMKQYLGWANNREDGDRGLLWLLVEKDIGDQLKGVSI